MWLLPPSEGGSSHLLPVPSTDRAAGIAHLSVTGVPEDPVGPLLVSVSTACLWCTHAGKTLKHFKKKKSPTIIYPASKQTHLVMNLNHSSTLGNWFIIKVLISQKLGS